MSDPVSSQPVRVTFFEDRAEVQRSARAAVGVGKAQVLVTGVTPLLHDASLAVRCQGQGVRVASARVLRRLETVASPLLGELPALEEDRRAARRLRDEADRALLRAQDEQTRALAQEEALAQALARVPEGAAEQGDELQGRLRQLEAQLAAGLDRAQAAVAELRRAHLDQERAEARLAAAQSRDQRARTLIEVQLEADGPREVELVLTYQTPCALWRPEHQAKLAAGPAGGERLELTTFATAWQRTGEEWEGVRCLFSTARPARPASPPLLHDDLLVSRRKSAEERKTVVVEAREEAVQLAGLARGARAVDEMPGVEDGGEPLWLEGAQPASIPSDGQPVRIELARLELPCTAERIAFPELSAAVHVRATATLTGKQPLLAGPVVLVRRTEAVGRGRTRFVAAGEPFELGFGIDDGLRVRRHTREARETTPVIGTQKVTRTVELFVTNLGAEARALVVQERVPVSEIGEVRIELVQWDGGPLSADGFARQTLQLPPGATQKLTLVYRIEASAKVQLPPGG